MVDVNVLSFKQVAAKKMNSLKGIRIGIRFEKQHSDELKTNKILINLRLIAKFIFNEDGAEICSFLKEGKNYFEFTNFKFERTNRGMGWPIISNAKKFTVQSPLAIHDLRICGFDYSRIISENRCI